MFSFSSDSSYDSVACDPVKTGLSELQAEAEEDLEETQNTSSHTL